MNDDIPSTSSAFVDPVDPVVETLPGQQIGTCITWELLDTIEASMICKGLPEDSRVKSVAIDPNTDTTVPIPRTVIRHSIPHVPSPKQFKATIFYRSKDCHVLLDTSECCGSM